MIEKQSLKYYWIVAPNGSTRWAIQDFINIQWGADFNTDVQIHWPKTPLLAGRFWKHLSQLLSSWFGGLWCISCLPSFACQGYSRELFQFEKDRFDNVPALIRFYVGGRQPISQASGAVIFHPITRTLPLRVIIEQQAVPDSRGAGSDKQAKSGKRRSLSTAHADMLQIINPLLRSDEACRNACTQIQIKSLCTILFIYFFCPAGVEVSLQIWRMLDVGLHFSQRSLTATYGLVQY